MDNEKPFFSPISAPQAWTSSVRPLWNTLKVEWKEATEDKRSFNWKLAHGEITDNDITTSPEESKRLLDEIFEADEAVRYNRRLIKGETEESTDDAPF
jgi:hypothetical protein